MNGREIEHLLSAIDENIRLSRVSFSREILSYLQQYESKVLTELRTAGKVTVPTSSGPVDVNLSDLQMLVA